MTPTSLAPQAEGVYCQGVWEVLDPPPNQEDTVADYVTRNPAADPTVNADGTTTQEVAAIGRNQYMAPTGRFPAFIGLAKATGGVYVENTNGMTVDRALTAANLNFTADFTPVEGTIVDADGVEKITSDVYRNVYATHPRGPDGIRPRRTHLGVVKGRYEIVQPYQAAEFAQAVVDEAGGTVVAVGGYGKPTGTRMYLAIKLPEGLTVAGNDPHDLYMTVGNSFDGSTGLWSCLAPIRLSCTNQVEATFGSLSNRITIRHTGDPAQKVEEVRRALKIHGTWVEKWQATAETMLATPLTAELDAFLEKLLRTPANATARSENTWAARRNTIADLARNSPTCEFGRGTAYAAYQAVAEYADHLRPSRSLDRGQRYARVLDGGYGEELKTRAVRLLTH